MKLMMLANCSEFIHTEMPILKCCMEFTILIKFNQIFSNFIIIIKVKINICPKPNIKHNIPLFKLLCSYRYNTKGTFNNIYLKLAACK